MNVRLSIDMIIFYVLVLEIDLCLFKSGKENFLLLLLLIKILPFINAGNTLKLF